MGIKSEHSSSCSFLTRKTPGKSGLSSLIRADRRPGSTSNVTRDGTAGVLRATLVDNNFSEVRLGGSNDFNR
jgi:hypothetical protein